MEVSFELLIVLMPTILFTLATILIEDTKRILFSLLSALCWIVLGIGFVGTNPTYPAYGLLFFGIALIFIVLTLRDSLDLLRGRGKKPKDWWKE